MEFGLILKGVFALLFLALLIPLYFAPTLIAEHRGHPNDTPIFILNIFLGWTVLVWILLLAWAFSVVRK